MKLRKRLSLVLLFCVVLCLTACGSQENAVYVQSVKDLSSLGGTF